MRTDEIDSAFALLIEAFDGVIRTLNEEVARAVTGSDHERAKRQLDLAISANSLRSKVRDLSDEWRALAPGAGSPAVMRSPRRESAGSKSSSSKKDKRHQRLDRGLRTPQIEYRGPILAVLARMGGSGRASDVLARVHEIMKPRLTQHDHEPLPSNPKAFRWYNAAQWCRNDLANEGLISRDTPSGIWQLTDEGWHEARKNEIGGQS